LALQQDPAAVEIRDLPGNGKAHAHLAGYGQRLTALVPEKDVCQIPVGNAAAVIGHHKVKIRLLPGQLDGDFPPSATALMLLDSRLSKRRSRYRATP
jgi:hypothetical protein